MNQGIIQLVRSQTQQPAGFGMAVGDDSERTSLAPDAWLHGQEVVYRDQLIQPGIRASYYLGRVAAKRALGSLFPQVAAREILIDRGVFGFPVVKNGHLPNLQVSIAHCQATAVALAFPEAHPMGVDLERICPERVAASESLLTPLEHALVAGLPVAHPVGLTLLWTIKEALAKVLRCGLTVEWSLLAPKQLEQTNDGWKGLFENFGQYQSWSWVSRSWVCSVVLPAQTTANFNALRECLTAFE